MQSITPYQQSGSNRSRSRYTFRHERESDLTRLGRLSQFRHCPLYCLSSDCAWVDSVQLTLSPRRLCLSHCPCVDSASDLDIPDYIYLPLSFVIHMGRSYLAALVCLSTRDSAACAASLVTCVQFPVSLPRCLGHMAPFQSGEGGVPVPVPRGRRQRVFRVTRLVS